MFGIITSLRRYIVTPEKPRKIPEDFEINPAFLDIARAKVRKEDKKRIYITECVNAGICPRCGETLFVLPQDSYEIWRCPNGHGWT